MKNINNLLPFLLFAPFIVILGLGIAGLVTKHSVFYKILGGIAVVSLILAILTLGLKLSGLSRVIGWPK